eukprot:s124_g16.t1
MLRVNVSLPSGRGETLLLPELSTVEDLQILAQESFGQKLLRLVTSKNRALTNPKDSLQAAEIQEGEHLTAVVQQAKVASTGGAFAVWCCGGDRIVTWGNPMQGANSSVIKGQLSSIEQVQATNPSMSCSGAFAAILEDGSVVTWGSPRCGGDSSAVQEQLRNVRQIQATDAAFAAVLDNGSVVTWGNPEFGGDSSAVQEQLRNVQQIQATRAAFAALLDNGSVVTWGRPRSGGDSSAVQEQLRNVRQIQATDVAFAAVLDNGSVVTWGSPGWGGDSSAVQEQLRLRNVRQIQATRAAFAAVLDNGSVVTWGDPRSGGDSSAVPEQLRNVQQIQATRVAFAAVLNNGSVVTWGNPRWGGDSSAVQEQLRNVQQIQATDTAFAAVLDNGSVVTWGDPRCGGDSSAVQEQLRNVRQIQVTQAAFAAFLDNGSVVTWGDPRCGGDSSAVQEQLRNVQQIQSTDAAFAAVLDNGSIVTWGNPESGGDSSAVQDLLQCDATTLVSTTATGSGFVQQLPAGSYELIFRNNDQALADAVPFFVTWGIAATNAEAVPAVSCDNAARMDDAAVGGSASARQGSWEFKKQLNIAALPNALKLPVTVPQPAVATIASWSPFTQHYVRVALVSDEGLWVGEQRGRRSSLEIELPPGDYQMMVEEMSPLSPPTGCMAMGVAVSLVPFSAIERSSSAVGSVPPFLGSSLGLGARCDGLGALPLPLDAISDTGGSAAYGGPVDADGRLLIRERIMLTDIHDGRKKLFLRLPAASMLRVAVVSEDAMETEVVLEDSSHQQIAPVESHIMGEGQAASYIMEAPAPGLWLSFHREHRVAQSAGCASFDLLMQSAPMQDMVKMSACGSEPRELRDMVEKVLEHFHESTISSSEGRLRIPGTTSGSSGSSGSTGALHLRLAEESLVEVEVQFNFMLSNVHLWLDSGAGHGRGLALRVLAHGTAAAEKNAAAQLRLRLDAGDHVVRIRHDPAFPAEEAMSGYLEPSPDGCEMINLQVLCLNGEGREVRQMALEQLPPKRGAKLALQYLASPLVLGQTLQEQGIAGQDVTLSCTYVPTDMCAAWRYASGHVHGIEEESALEGLTEMIGASDGEYLRHLPSSLENLTFGLRFNQGLKGMKFPSSLQSLTFGDFFDQSLEGVTFPSSLQSLTFGDDFNQSPEGVTFPGSLQNLTFGLRFNQSLKGVTFPSSLQSLTFGDFFDQSLKGVIFPSSLQTLTFGDFFDQSLEGVTFPNSLQSLTFGDDFNQSLEGVTFPSPLHDLTFGKRFNQSLEGVTFPSPLHDLTFGKRFNQSLKGVTFPTTLQSLTFGGEFNQSLEGVTFPCSLQSLTFGHGFSQSLEGVTFPSSVTFPSRLEDLTFGRHFNQSLKGVTFPSSLQSLTFGRVFDQSLERVTFPSSLQILTFGTQFNQSLEGVTFPSRLQDLTFGKRFNQSLKGVTLPSTLESLTFGCEFNQSLEGVTFPSSLQSLTFGNLFDQSLERVTFPSSLQSLTFGDFFDQSLKGVTFPSSLQSLTFGVDFDQSLEGVTFPSSLQSLTFGHDFNQSLERVTFPSSLQILTFGTQFNQSLEGVTFPSRLEDLTFGRHFNQSLKGVTLPSTLESLTFGCEFNQSLEGVTFPSSLQSLTFGHVFNQSLKGVTFPSNLQSMTFGRGFDQNLEGVTFPSRLQDLTFGNRFNQSLKGVTFPSSLQSLAFGDASPIKLLVAGAQCAPLSLKLRRVAVRTHRPVVSMPMVPLVSGSDLVLRVDDVGAATSAAMLAQRPPSAASQGSRGGHTLAWSSQALSGLLGVSGRLVTPAPARSSRDAVLPGRWPFWVTVEECRRRQETLQSSFPMRLISLPRLRPWRRRAPWRARCSAQLVPVAGKTAPVPVVPEPWQVEEPGECAIFRYASPGAARAALTSLLHRSDAARRKEALYVLRGAKMAELCDLAERTEEELMELESEKEVTALLRRFLLDAASIELQIEDAVEHLVTLTPLPETLLAAFGTQHGRVMLGADGTGVGGWGRGDSYLVNSYAMGSAKLEHWDLVQHQVGLLQQFREFWMEDHLCDVVLKSNDGAEHRAHAALLSAASLFFKQLLGGSFLEADQMQRGQPVEMAASTAAVSALLDFVYGGQPEVSVETGLELLRLAEAYDLRKLADAIETGLGASLDSADFETCSIQTLESSDRTAFVGLLLQHVDFQSISVDNLLRLGCFTLSGPDGRDLQQEVNEALKARPQIPHKFQPKRQCLQHWSPDLGASSSALGREVLPVPCNSMCWHDGAIYVSDNRGSILCWKPGDPAADARRVAGAGAAVNGIDNLGSRCELAISPAGEVFVADLDNGRLVCFQDGSGHLVLDDFTCTTLFCSPSGVLYILDMDGKAVRKLVGSTLETVIDSHALAVNLQFTASQIFVVNEEMIYLLDFDNTRILRINPDEALKPVVVGQIPFEHNQVCWNLFVAESGTMYVVDTGQRKVLAFRPGTTHHTDVLQCSDHLFPNEVLVQDRSLYVAMLDQWRQPSAGGIYEFVLPPELQLE